MELQTGRKLAAHMGSFGQTLSSMARTKAGYKHKGGDTQADERFRQQAELIADQQNQIEELQKPVEEIAPVELNGAVDEADFAGLE